MIWNKLTFDFELTDELPTVCDDHLALRAAFGISGLVLHLPDHLLATDDVAKHHMDPAGHHKMDVQSLWDL